MRRLGLVDLLVVALLLGLLVFAARYDSRHLAERAAGPASKLRISTPP